MKQPFNHFIDFKDDDGSYWVDMSCDFDSGGVLQVGVGRGRTKKSALKASIRRMKKLTKELEKLYTKEG